MLHESACHNRLACDERIHKGDTVYIVHSKRFIREATVICEDAGGMYAIRFTDADGGIRVRRNRLFKKRADAEKQIPSNRHSFPL